MKPGERVARAPVGTTHRPRHGVEGAVRERVAVDHEQGSPVSSAPPRATRSRRGADPWRRRQPSPRGRAARSSELDRRCRRRPGAVRAARSGLCPQKAAGTSGTPASRAMRAAPVCQRASNFFRRPFSRRVPSGNMTTTWPSRQRRDRRLDRLLVALPASHLEAAAGRGSRALSGNQNNSAFAMKRRKRRGKSGSPSGHGSRFDQWLAERT